MYTTGTTTGFPGKTLELYSISVGPSILLNQAGIPYEGIVNLNT